MCGPALLPDALGLQPLEELMRLPLLHDRVTGTGDGASGLQLRQIASRHAFHVASSLTLLCGCNFLRILALPASAMAFSIQERTPSSGVLGVVNPLEVN